MNLNRSILTARMISSFGSWLTFMGTALMIQEHFGAKNVAYAFLLQSIPALLIPKWVINKVKSHRLLDSWIFGQILLAANVAALTLHLGLAHVYIYLFIASTLNALLNPIYMSWTGIAVTPTDRALVQTRSQAINSGMLALAPPIGGVLCAVLGYDYLFTLDAITFLASGAILLPFCSFRIKIPASVEVSSTSNHTQIYPHALKSLLWTWAIFLCLGGLLNTVEFFVFSRSELSKSEIGFALGAWGVGNLVNFLSIKPKASYVAGFYVLSLLAFMISRNYAVILASFFIAGWANAWLSGKQRASIQNAISKDLSAMNVWTDIQRSTSVVNLIFYGLGGYFLLEKNYIFFGVSMFAIGVVFFARYLTRFQNQCLSRSGQT
jgi:hypothetical protein